LLEHGWSYRGGGYNKQVPPQAWADFDKYVRLAAEYLAAHSDVAFADSRAHQTLINIGRAAGWDRDKLWSLAQAGIKKDPENDGLYLAVLTSLLPKWNGSPAQVDRFIAQVVERTRKERGMELYARLYSAAAAQEFEHRLLSDSGAEWPKMMAGFRDLQARYPSAWNLNRFAYFACLAQDKPTTLDLLEQIGPKPQLNRWGTNASRTYETCKRWASQQ